MSIKVIGKDSLCGIVAISITVSLRKHYAVHIIMDGSEFINADIETDDLHEIVHSEESLEYMFPGIMKLARTA